MRRLRIALRVNLNSLVDEATEIAGAVPALALQAQVVIDDSRRQLAVLQHSIWFPYARADRAYRGRISRNMATLNADFDAAATRRADELRPTWATTPAKKRLSLLSNPEGLLNRAAFLKLAAGMS